MALVTVITLACLVNSGQGARSKVTCPKATTYGKGPPASCAGPTDPNNRPKSKLESWFTAETFNDLFPKANLGWGPNKCWPYSYEAFAIAARYFPKFGTEAPDNGFTAEENYKRDLATFFAHAIQETGENNPNLPDDCFFRGGFFNWFEGGPQSAFLPLATPGFDPKDGEKCITNGQYCTKNDNFPCSMEKDGAYFKGCYFGRGAIQISYNYNYGPFQQWLKTQGIEVDLLKNPNLVMTKMDPPLSIMASMWFYMTPQAPKPAMHDIIMGNWTPAAVDAAAGYKGAIFGPTSLIINNECGGEIGGGGESRRIKAYKWFSKYFGFRVEDDNFLSCKNMQGRPFGVMGSGIPQTWSQPKPNPNPKPGPGTGGNNPGGPFSCPGAGLFADPASCSSYYECVDSETFYNRACPSGLHFNPAITNCDWPDSAKCQKRG
jgi:hypothetical protein